MVNNDWFFMDLFFLIVKEGKEWEFGLVIYFKIIDI